MLEVQLVILGLAVGVVSGFFGIGGGTIIVPFLMLLGYNIKAAIGLSVMQMCFSSMLGSYINYKHKILKINDGIYLGVGGFVGGFIGGFVVKFFSEKFLTIVFLASLLLAIVKFFKTDIQTQKQANESKPLLIIIGFFIGLIAISIGIGGGLFVTPILVGMLGYDLKRAVSTGLFLVVFSSFSGFISQLFHRLFSFNDGLILTAGSLVGVYFGVKLAQKANKNIQKYLLLCMYIFLFIITLIQFLGK